MVGASVEQSITEWFGFNFQPFRGICVVEAIDRNALDNCTIYGQLDNAETTQP